MESELNEILSDSLTGNITLKHINYKDLFIPNAYHLIADSIEYFEVRDDDVWVCSFPRSGTTWTQEMVWNIANDLDFKAAEVPIHKRFSYLEFVGAFPLAATFIDPTNFRGSALKYVNDIAISPSPRFIKTHLPFHLLPRQLRERERKCKIVHVSRNPKDICISYYHLCKTVAKYSGTFEDFCELFLGDKVIYAPYWNHINGYLMANYNNIICIKFEDMKSNLRSTMQKVASFLGKTLNEEQTKSLESHLSFACMEKNPAVNYVKAFEDIIATLKGNALEDNAKFMRLGKVGQWKTVMSEKLIKQFDDWILENSKSF